MFYARLFPKRDVNRLGLLKAVRIRYKATEAVLLEVDTSDGIKMLSTKVLFGSELQDWIDQFLQIRKGVVAKSINTVGYVP